MSCGVGSALALALTLATPAAAADGYPGAPPAGAGNDMPLPGAPDMRPEWHGGNANVALMPDSQTRAAWLGECRHRMAFYYENGGFYRRGYRHHHDGDHNDGYAPGYDYCEAYFDDYYRTYTQPGYAYAYPAMVSMRPTFMAPSYQSAGQRSEEVVTERYEPVRSWVIPHRRARRSIHDKRIRVAT